MTRFLSLRLGLATLVAVALFITGVNPSEARAASAPPAAVAVSVQQIESAPERTKAEARVVPVLVVLALLARIGIGAIVKQLGKTAVKNATKSFLLNNINANKWSHILQTKHKWKSVGGNSKGQVAEIMSNAMANGTHSAHGSAAKKAQWVYKGKTIVVTYAKNGGKISDGWVK